MKKLLLLLLLPICGSGVILGQRISPSSPSSLYPVAGYTSFSWAASPGTPSAGSTQNPVAVAQWHFASNDLSNGSDWLYSIVSTAKKEYIGCGYSATAANSRVASIMKLGHLGLLSWSTPLTSASYLNFSGWTVSSHSVSSSSVSVGISSLWRVAKANDGYVAVGHFNNDATYGTGILIVEFDDDGNLRNGTPLEVIPPANPGGAGSTSMFPSSNAASLSFSKPAGEAFSVAIDPNTNSINNIIIGGTVADNDGAAPQNRRAFILTMNYSGGWDIGNTFYGGNNYGTSAGYGGNTISRILTKSTGATTYNIYACGAISGSDDNILRSLDPYGNTLTSTITTYDKDIWVLGTSYDRSSNTFGAITSQQYNKNNIYVGGTPINTVNSTTYPYQSMGPVTARNYMTSSGHITGIMTVNATSSSSPSSWFRTTTPNQSIWLSAPENEAEEGCDMIMDDAGNLELITLVNIVGSFMDGIVFLSPQDYGLTGNPWWDGGHEYEDGDGFLLNINPGTLAINSARNVEHFSGADFTMNIKENRMNDIIICGSTADMQGTYTGTPPSVSAYTPSPNPNRLDPTLYSEGSGWNALIVIINGGVVTTAAGVETTRSFLAADTRAGADYEQTFCLFGMDTCADDGFIICGNNDNASDDWSVTKFAPHNEQLYQLGSFYERFGHGTYNPYMGPNCTPDVYTITGPETWSTPKIIGSKVIVAPGGSLTISGNPNIYFAASNELWDYWAFPNTFAGGQQGCGIVVEPGGHLYINNAQIQGLTFTNGSLTDRNMWDGITIQGVPTSASASVQGQATISNNSIIQDAIYGAWVNDVYRTYLSESAGMPPVGNMQPSVHGSWYAGYTNDGGGVMNVQNSTFQNCYSAVNFNSYPHHNSSLFYNNTFACNGNGLADICTYTTYDEGKVLPSSVHMVLNRVYGVTCAGNTFNCDASFSAEERSMGILSADGGINATPACIGGGIVILGGGCGGTVVPGNTFQNLATGVYIINTGASAAMNTITNNTFDNNGYGVMANTPYAGLIVKNNQFQVPGYGVGFCCGGLMYWPLSIGGYTPYYPLPSGVLLAGSNGYNVSQNTFDKCSTCSDFGSWWGNRGVVVNQGSGQNDVVNLNTFNNIYYATLAAQTNSGSIVVSGVSKSTGLQILCNNFNESLIDIDRSSTLLGYTATIAGSIDQQQGACGSATSPAGNQFNSACYYGNSYLHADDGSVVQNVQYNNNGASTVFDPNTCIQSSIYTDNPCSGIPPIVAAACPVPPEYGAGTSVSSYATLSALDEAINATSEPDVINELQTQHDLEVANLARYYGLNEYFDSAASLLLSYRMYAQALPFLLQSGNYTGAADALGSMPLHTAGDTLYAYIMGLANNIYSSGNTWLTDTSHLDTMRRIVQYNSPAGYMAGAISVMESGGQMTWPIPAPDSATMDTLLNELIAGSEGRPAHGGAATPILNVNDARQPAFSLYPNPTYGSLTVNTACSGRFVLYTMLGQELQAYNLPAGQANLQLPANLAAGMYMGQFKPDNGGATKEVRLVYQP